MKLCFYLVLLFILISCDRDDTPGYNYFSVDGMEFKIENCVIFKGFEDDTSGLFDLGFYFDQLEYWRFDSLNLVSHIPKQKNGIFFRGGKFTKVIRQGDYYFGESIPNPWGYVDANLVFNWNGETNMDSCEANLNLGAPLRGGTLSITTKNENYIIEFDCFDIGYRKIKGYFSGVPIEVNYVIK